MAETVKLLVDHGADVAALDMTNSTPLHVAVSSWNIDVIRILVEGGADVNAQNETDSTPLHIASIGGGAETVQLLLEHGADATIRDWKLSTPLHFASHLVSFEIYCGDSFHNLELMSNDRLTPPSFKPKVIARI